jgi:hypothetical protein
MIINFWKRKKKNRHLLMKITKENEGQKLYNILSGNTLKNNNYIFLSLGLNGESFFNLIKESELSDKGVHILKKPSKITKDNVNYIEKTPSLTQISLLISEYLYNRKNKFCIIHRPEELFNYKHDSQIKPFIQFMLRTFDEQGCSTICICEDNEKTEKLQKIVNDEFCETLKL